MARYTTTRTGDWLPAHHDGVEERFLGRVAEARTPKMCGRWSDSGNPTLPLSQIQDFDWSNPLIPIYDQDGNGCHSDDTEVLTEHGWTRWADYDRQSIVGTMNPVTGNLEFQMPSAFQAYDYDGELYHSQNRCLDFAVTPNHRMFVRKWDERKRTLSSEYGFQNASDLGWYVGLPHATSGFAGVGLNRISIGGGQQMAGDDFLGLVALVISDGWVGGTENTWNRVSFCCFREDRREMVAALAHRLGFSEQPNRRGVWMLSDPELAQWFRESAYTDPSLGAEHKMVPSIVKTVSSHQIELFLKFFGDQRINVGRGNGTGKVFWSASRRMVDDLQELLLRIGKRGTISEREPRDTVMKDGREIKAENCHTEHSLVERTTERLCIDRKKHLVTDHYKGTVFCATVPNGILVTRRNGSILVSGNSCVGHGVIRAFEQARLAAGQTYVPLSPDGLYAHINGGRDQGAAPTDGVNWLITGGAETLADVPDVYILERNIPAAARQTALRFRLNHLQVYQLNTFQECVTASYLRYAVILTVNVGGAFTPNSSTGLVNFTGGTANHCVCATGKWVAKGGYYWFDNSWRSTWGVGGRGSIQVQHIDRQSQSDLWAVKGVIPDPLDPLNPPV